jgi:hypothetical protein
MPDKITTKKLQELRTAVDLFLKRKANVHLEQDFENRQHVFLLRVDIPSIALDANGVALVNTAGQLVYRIASVPFDGVADEIEPVVLPFKKEEPADGGPADPSGLPTA